MNLSFFFLFAEQSIVHPFNSLYSLEGIRMRECNFDRKLIVQSLHMCITRMMNNADMMQVFFNSITFTSSHSMDTPLSADKQAGDLLRRIQTITRQMNHRMTRVESLDCETVELSLSLPHTQTVERGKLSICVDWEVVGIAFSSVRVLRVKASFFHSIKRSTSTLQYIWRRVRCAKWRIHLPDSKRHRLHVHPRAIEDCSRRCLHSGSHIKGVCSELR